MSQEKVIEKSSIVSRSTGLLIIRTKGIEFRGWGITKYWSEESGPYNVYGVVPDRLKQIEEEYGELKTY